MDVETATNAELVARWNKLAPAHQGRDTTEMKAIAREVHARFRAGLMSPVGTNVAYFAYKPVSGRVDELRRL